MKAIFGFVLCLAFVLVSCVQTPMVVHQGVKKSMEEAAQIEFKKGMNLYNANQTSKAYPVFENIVNQYAKSTLADDALFKMAEIQEKKKNLKSALMYYERLVGQFSKSELYNQAVLQVGLISHEMQNHFKAAQYFIKVSFQDKLQEQKRSILLDAWQSFDKAMLFDSKLQWLQSLYNNTDFQAQQSLISQESIKTFENVKSAETLQSFYKNVQDPNLQGHALFYMAKRHQASQDIDQAKTAINDFLEKHPHHSLYGQAMELSVILNVSSSKTKQEAVLGVLIPNDESRKVIGEKIVKGVELAKSLYENKIPNIKIEIDHEGENTDQLIEAFKRLVIEKKSKIIIGPTSLESTQVLVPLAKEYNVLILSLSSSENVPDLDDLVFRNSSTKSEQAQGLAYVAKNILKVTRVAILHPNNSYGQELTTLFKSAFEKEGGQIKTISPYEPDMSDLTTSIMKLTKILPKEDRASEICTDKESERRIKLKSIGQKVKLCFPSSKLPPHIDFEALFVPDGIERALQIIPSLSYYEVYGAYILGTNLWNSQMLLSRSVLNTNQSILFLDGFFKNKNDPVVSSFVTKFYEKYGEEPSIIEAHAFDSASIVFDFFISSEQDPSKYFLSIKNKDAVCGKITMLENGDFRHTLTPLYVDKSEIKPLQ